MSTRNRLKFRGGHPIRRQDAKLAVVNQDDKVGYIFSAGVIGFIMRAAVRFERFDYRIRARYSRNEFVTTEMLLKAIANAARIGCSCRRKTGRVSNGFKTPAATGIRITL